MVSNPAVSLISFEILGKTQWSQQSHISKHVKVKVTQSCLTLCDPMDCSPPGSFVHGILQARILDWGAPGNRGASQCGSTHEATSGMSS